MIAALRDVVAREDFDVAVRDLAAGLGRPRAEVRAEAIACLQELAAQHAPLPMAAWTRLGRWLLDGYEMHVDTAALAELRRLDETHTLVWLPSHRSYLDTWALPMALDSAGFEPYFVVGGANLDFWPFGDLARRTGLVFVRRRTQHDPVYRFALRQYLRDLVRRRADFGWSIEGGRTRTGKLRPPRYGLLRYLADAACAEEREDVLLVPTSIVWDGLQEVPKMVAEAVGQGKRGEDLRWLFEFGRRQRDARGRAYVDFGEPVPLAAQLAQLGGEPEGRGHEIERIALEVCHRINRVTPVTAAALVTVALLAADRALTAGELEDRVRPLLEYAEQREWTLAGPRPAGQGLEATLEELAAAGAATRIDARTRVWAIGRDQHLVAAFYRNSAAHLLLGRAIAELVAGLVGSIESEDALVRGREEALRLRDLLKFEFFFPRKREFVEEMRVEVALIREAPEPAVAPLILRPFLEAYLIVADELAARDPGAAIDEEPFLAACLALGRQWLGQRVIAREESVSLELFRTAVALARHRGLWEPGAGDLAARRQEFATELQETLARVVDTRAIVHSVRTV